MSIQQSWGIVGGGLLGMTMALRLAQQGQQVTLVESAKDLGGLAGAWQLGDVVWDRHYHVTLLSDASLRKLLAEIDLDKEIRWVQTKTGFYSGGQLYSMSNSVEFLKFPPLKLIDKLRLGLTIFHASRVSDWQALEQIPVVEWLRRWSGKTTTEKIWLPLLRAKLGSNYEKASAAFIWAIIARMYAARRSGMKKEMFGYVPAGYHRILARLAEHLHAQGVTLRTGFPVAEVRRAPDGRLSVASRTGERLAFDQVVVTAPSAPAADLCPDLAPFEKDQLRSIEYQGIVCASLLLRKPLSPYYVTNITDPCPFTAVIEMTALVDPATFGGRTLVYLPKYVPANDPALEFSDEQVKREFLPALQKMHPHLTDEDVLAFQVSRVRSVFAIPTLNYSKKLPSMTTSVAGLHVVNSSHIVNGTLNVNETVQLAERTVPQLVSQSTAAGKAAYARI